MGYTGGKKLNPTYHSLGDHTESLQVDFDPAQISYEQLLDIFWDSHNPTRGSWSSQYRAAVFVHTDEQARLAELSKTRIAAEKTGRWFKQQIRTEILPAETFYLAEEYHQKYYLQNSPRIWGDILEIYRDDATGWINSTATARLNGYAGEYGTVARLEEEIESLGLSAPGQEQLRQVVQRFNRK